MKSIINVKITFEHEKDLVGADKKRLTAEEIVSTIIPVDTFPGSTVDTEVISAVIQRSDGGLIVTADARMRRSLGLVN